MKRYSDREIFESNNLIFHFREGGGVYTFINNDN